MQDEAANLANEVFYAAVEMAPEKRQDYLNQACAGDPTLQARVEKMLASYSEADRFFQESLQSSIDFAQLGREVTAVARQYSGLDEEPEKQVGPYKLIERLGEGGCGAVYLAEQEQPVRRQVALKIIKLGMDTRSFVAQFRAECQALAMMDHPNIARVLDAGATEHGRPYLVMELVRGMKVTEFCDANKYGLQQRLELFVKVCQAIQHAHQKGIIHRDIKPSNVLVTLIDGQPVPKVIDFGIAKAIGGERLVDVTVFTACEHLVGTPVYMSPEQAALGGMDVDTRSDIYSLGVLLYELLTGKTPFDQMKLAQAGFDEMRRVLREQEPSRPSIKLMDLPRKELQQAASDRGLDADRFKLALRGDLDWIVMKALEKDRNRRYETANGLGMDVLRFLDNEPVLARSPSQLYKFQKLVRRNRAISVAIAAVVLTLTLGLGLSTWLFLGERAARLEERAARDRAEAAERQQIRLRIESDRLRQAGEFRQRLTQATVARSRGKIEEADRLVAGIPLPEPNLEYADLYRALGDWHASNGSWEPAADRFGVLEQVNQPDDWDTTTLDYLRYGAALLEKGDTDGYERFRRSAVAHFAETPNPVAAERVLKASLLTPPSAELLAALQPLALTASNSLAEAQAPEDVWAMMAAWRSFSLALWEYRRGNYAGVERWHEKLPADKTTYECRLIFDVVTAMAHWQTGQRELARTELARARQHIEGRFDHMPLGDYWWDWVFPQILLQEATGLMSKEQKAN
ncbi:MAG TPA: serine/threonine-protein kinase [Verrucomicrobiae bacterium]